MSLYIEFREELRSSSLRNKVVLLDKLYENIDPYKDSYRGLFHYTEEMLKHVTETGSVKGFKGKSGVEYLVWDFDNVELELSRQDAVTLIDRLIADYSVKENEIGVFFSGRKGFAVEIRTKGIVGLDGALSENTPLYVKKICLAIAGDLKTVDKGIYNHIRLYRIAGTLHDKESDVDGRPVRLFKTSLSVPMLRNSTIDEIKRFAVQIRIPHLFDILSDASKLSDLLSKSMVEVETVSRKLISLPSITSEGLTDDRNAPRMFKTCIWRLCQGDYVEGRNNALLRIADHERKTGMPQAVVKAKLLGVLDLMNARDPKKAQMDPILEPEIDTIVSQVFKNDYDYGCNDFVLDAVCSRKCHLAPKKFEESKADVITLLDAYKRSKSWYKGYHSNVVQTGFTTIDERMPLYLGTFNLIVGKPGTGKTSFMLNIMNNASKGNIPALFFNMDMSQEMLIQRCAPILLAEDIKEQIISGKQFMEGHARNDEGLMSKSLEAFEKVSENVLISSQTHMTVKDIGAEIDRQENMWGRKVKLVIIDYVQLIKSDYLGFANDTFNAHSLAELSKNKNICILGLSQTSRNNVNDEMILAKGSGAWEEKASTQVNCFRPFKDSHPDYDYIMGIKMFKNRMGDTGTIDLFFHGASGIVRDLVQEEQMELAGLRKQLEHKDD